MHLRGILLRQAFSPIFPGIPQDAKEGVRFLRVRCILMFRKGRIHHLDTGSYIYTYVGCCLLPPPAKIGKLLIYIYIYPLKPTQSYVLEGWKTTGAVSVSYIFGKMINYVCQEICSWKDSVLAHFTLSLTYRAWLRWFLFSLSISRNTFSKIPVVNSPKPAAQQSVSPCRTGVIADVRF